MKYRRGAQYNLQKLIWEILLVTLLILLIISWKFYLQEREKRKALFFKESSSVIERTEKTFYNWLDSQIQLAQLLAEDPRLIAACTNPRDEELVDMATRFLLRVHSRFSYYENLPLTSFVHPPFERTVSGKSMTVHSGTFFTDTADGTTVGMGGESYSYRGEIRAGRPYFVSEVYPSLFRDNPILVISAPVLNGDRLVGAVMLSPQMNFITKTLVDLVKFGEEGHLVLLDSGGEVLTPPNSSPERPDKDYTHIVERIRRGNFQFTDECSTEESYFNGRKIDLNTKNSNNKWYLVANLPVEEADEDAFNYFLLSLSLLVAMVLILIGGLLLLIFRREGVLKQKAQELEIRAQTDSLSSLYNRGYFLMLLDKELSEYPDRNLTIILFDLDYFKRINDEFGHSEGDRVIVQTAKAIQHSIRKDDIAARYGGEEFIIAMIDTNLETGVKIAKRIQENLKRHPHPDSEKNITASFGVRQWRGESREELIQKADELLYRAKEGGRNRVEWEIQE